MTQRYGLRDDQWDRIKDLLPGREESVDVTAKDNRLFVEAVLYRYRAGIPWRDLPERFGAWKAIHTLVAVGCEWHVLTINYAAHANFRDVLCETSTRQPSQ